jgi:predicted permease
MTFSRLLDDLKSDLKFAWRLLVRNPAFAMVAVLSLALGVGGTTAIFTLMDAIVLRTLPVPHPSELYLAEQGDSGSSPSQRFSHPLFLKVRDELRGRAEVCASSSVASMLTGTSEQDLPEIGRVQLVSGECFAVLRQRPQLGRLLTPGDSVMLDGHPVAVVSDGFWTRRLARDPDIVSKPLTINGVAFTIVGVTQPGFFGATIDSRVDVWIPAMMQHLVRYASNVSVTNGDTDRPWIPQPHVSWLTLLLRVPFTEASGGIADRITMLRRQELLGDQSARTDPDAQRRAQAVKVTLAPGDRGFSRLRNQMRAPLVVLLVMASLLLLIACANIASLLLARSATRQRELAVRVSIGAGRSRVVRQLLVESLLLAFVGGGLGLLVARWSTDGLMSLFSSSNSAPAYDASMSGRVLLFALGISVATGLLFGLLPAIRAARVSPVETLNASSSRSPSCCSAWPASSRARCRSSGR